MSMTTTLIRENGIGNNNYKSYEVKMGTHTIQTLVTTSPCQVGIWLSTNTRNTHDNLKIVGLDVEWRPNTQSNSQQPNPVATLQLCIDHNCLIFQILHATLVPRALTSFLANRHVNFVGVGVRDDAQKLLRDYNLHVANAVDLRSLAEQKLKVFWLGSAGLAALGRFFLGVDINKPHHITTSLWDNRFLTHEQVQYATIDAFVSSEIGRRILIS